MLLLWAGLQTRWAKDRLTGLVASLTSRSDTRIRMEGLHGILPFSFSVAHVSLSDTRGTFMEARKADMSLHPWSLISGFLDVDSLRVETLSILRRPEPTPDEDEKDDEAGKEAFLPSLPRVMIRDIHVERIEWTEEAAGIPMAYTLKSQVETLNRVLRARLVLKRLERPDDALRLKGKYDLRDRHVSAKITYHESNGGLLSGLARLKNVEHIRVDLNADGPLSGLAGRLKLEAGGYGKADIGFELSLSEKRDIALKGRIQANERIVPPRVTSALGGTDVGVTCRAALAPNQDLTIQALKLQAPSTTLSLSGSVDLTQRYMDVQMRANPVDVSAFIPKAAMDVRGLGPIRLTAKGPFHHPAFHVSATADELQTEEGKFKAISFNGKVVPDVGFTGFETAEIFLRAKDMNLPQMPGLRGPFQADLVTTTPDFTTWEMETLHLKVRDAEVHIEEGRINTQNGSFSTKLTAHTDRLEALLPPNKLAIDGKVNARVFAQGNVRTRQINADLTATLSDVAGLSPAATQAMGPPLHLNTRLALKQRTLQLRHVRIAGRDRELHADGQIEMGTGRFDVQYHLNMNPLPEMASTAGVKVSGSMEGDGRLRGRFDNFDAEMRLHSKQLKINHLDIESINAHIAAKELPRNPAGTLNLTATALKQPLAVNTAFTWAHDTLSLSRTQVKLPGVNLDADLTLSTADGRVTGKAQGAIESLDILEAASGVDAQGRGRFRIEAGENGGRQSANVDVRLNDLAYDGYAVGSFHLNTRIDDIHALKGRAEIQARDATYQFLRLKKVVLQAEGDRRNARVRMETHGTLSPSGHQGQSHSPVMLRARLDVANEELWRFRFDHLNALYQGLNITLPHPASITWDGDRITLETFELASENSRLRAEGELSGEDIHLNAHLDEFPLAFLEPIINRNLTGTASLQINLSGPLADPTVGLDVQVHDHRIATGKHMEPLVLEAKINAQRRDEHFQVNGDISGFGKAPFTVTASIPAHVTLKPPACHLDPSAKLSARLQGHLNMAILKGLPGMSDQEVRGRVDVDLGIEGTVDQWGLTGGLALTRGRYENMAQGMILDQIKGRVEARDRSLFLSELTATDGAKGTIALEGDIRMMPPFPINIRLSLDQAHLIRKEILTSETSGKLHLQGDKDKLNLSGDIVLNRTELTIPRRLPADVVEIPVKEINRPQGMAVEAYEKPSEALKFLSMDVAVKIPARFFVRGRGLDAEFKGNIHVSGPAHKPVVRGTLSVVRGSYQFLARTFHMTQGQIAFDGSSPPTPFLNVSAEVNAGEIDAQVRITGPVDDFTLSLTSQPPLPQDEIMANILFGQSAAKLNPFQAYQLASALAQFSGRNLPDVVGKTRKLLGMDRLTVSGGNRDNDPDSGPSVEVGKYVSDKVYVGVEQDLTDAKQDVVVEVELTPNFSVESKAGTKSGAGLGFSWKYDY